MNPWKIDADNLDFSKVDVDEIYNHIVVTPRIEDYLHYGHDDTKLIVVAPKGLGKTLLLKAKSHIYRQKAKSYRCIPSGTELVEKLVTIKHSFPKDLLASFEKQETWERLWELSIFIWIFKQFRIPLPREIEKELGSAESLYDIVRLFLTSRQSIYTFQNFSATHLSPQINKLGQIAIFIDNIDEGLEQHIGEDLITSQKQTVSENVWVKAQVGLMHVIRHLCSRNKHLKIFASVRSEAANCDYSQTARQLRTDWCVDLKYSKKQIREIFTQKIKQTPIRALVNPDGKNAIDAFIGFTKIPHRFAKQKNRAPRVEDVFDFIYRHTFGRPRDIVSMGNRIYSQDPDTRTEEVIREIVNEESSELLEGYKNEIVPFFRDDVFKTFCALTDKNVISEPEKEAIKELILDQHYDFPDIFTYLHSLGLVGTTEFSFDKNCDVQKFLPVGEYSFSKRSEPKMSRFYLLHSTMDKTLKDAHGVNFYDKNNIIGNGYEFHTPSSDKTLHVHFGLTKDSLSLIVPELNNSKSIAIIQEPSREYLELAQVENFILQKNSDAPIHFKVINKGLNDAQIQNLFSEWKKGENVIVYRNDAHTKSLFLNECETITLEGNNTLPEAALGKITESSPKKLLYLCQRFIHKDSLDAVKFQLQDSNLDKIISIETSLIDRLTLEGPTKEVVNTAVKYTVKAEKFGRIICLEREGSENEQNDIIRRTKNAEEQKFYEDRQKLLVEGIYRLTKIIKSELPKNERNNLKFIYETFFDIQIKRLLTTYNRERLRKFFAHLPESEFVTRLVKLCSDSKERFFKLEAFPKYMGGVDEYIEESKELQIFPRDEEFYEQVRKSDHFTNNASVIKLQDLMKVKSLKNYRSVFISFSEKNTDFAKKISDCLKKRGVDTYYYPDDPRHGDKKDIEKKEIDARERILFVVSQNSLMSKECQWELSLGIEKKRKLISEGRIKSELKDNFIPITLDDFLRKDDEELEGILGKDVMENIKIIQNTAFFDFTNFQKKTVDKAFERRVDDYILPALRKK